MLMTEVYKSSKPTANKSLASITIEALVIAPVSKFVMVILPSFSSKEAKVVSLAALILSRPDSKLSVSPLLPGSSIASLTS